jgi:hypothetical protein
MSDSSALRSGPVRAAKNVDAQCRVSRHDKELTAEFGDPAGADSAAIRSAPVRVVNAAARTNAAPASGVAFRDARTRAARLFGDPGTWSQETMTASSFPRSHARLLGSACDVMPAPLRAMHDL